MFQILPSILTSAELGAIRAIANAKPFADGQSRTGGAMTEGLKKNLELADTGAEDEISRIVLNGLRTRSNFDGIALPHAMRPFIVSRYEPGMRYGAHVDETQMGPLRADLSMTVFLSDPADYDGGELTANVDQIAQAIKLPAGHAVLYPSTSLHFVAPVTRGLRLAAVSWVQSRVRDSGKREILWDLLNALDHFRRQDTAKDPASLAHAAHERLKKAHANLMRRWADY
jgi:PKHD-type hydroxylase